MSTSSLTRISGLASGLDTDSLVKKLMDAERVPQNKMKQNQQKYTWQSDAYRQWNKDLFSFRSDTLFNMKLSKSFSTFNVSAIQSTTSNPSTAVSGTATADAVEGTYTLSDIKLAKSATFTGNKVALDPMKKLNDDAQGASKITTASTFTIQVFNDPANKTVSNTASITINPGDTINDVISNLNKLSSTDGKSLGLQASYDKNLQQFILKTKATGIDTKIVLSGDTSFLSGTLKLFDASNQDKDPTTDTASNPPTYTISGENAEFKFNDQPVSSASNSITIMGVNYTLKDKITDPVRVTVSRDLDTEVKNIKDFISKYNDLLDKLNTAIDEPVYSGYQPLTDDQRTQLSETQIKQWEDKAKSGLLRRDSILTSAVNDMRNIMTSTVNNGSVYNSLASIGIKSNSYADKGKLYVDENKLRAALQADPDAVKNLFTQVDNSSTTTSSTSATKSTTNSKNGLINRLYDDFSDQIKKLTDKAGSTSNLQMDQSVIGKLLSSNSARITAMDAMLQSKEDAYYRQFTAMETAMSKMNSQSSWLTQQLSGGSK